MISLILPYHSNAAHLFVCLRGLMETTENAIPIIIVKNSPQDELAAIPDSSRIKVIDAGGPVGYSAAVNIGVRSSHTEMVCLCDADTAYDRPWLEEHVRYLRRHKDIGVTGSKLVDMETGRIIDCGLGITPYCHFHPFIDRESTLPWLRHPFDVQATCSASMVFRRKVFDDVGGYDESYQHYYQDVDFCLRVRERGWRVQVLPDAQVFHAGSSARVDRQGMHMEMACYHFIKHHKRIVSDVAAFLEADLMRYHEIYRLRQDYNLINISTVRDFHSYQEILARHVTLHPLVTRAVGQRDCRHINLLEVLGDRPILSDLPLLYFTDRFRAVADNAYWLAYRRGCGDLVVDRHCNVVPTDVLLSPGQIGDPS